MPRSTWSAVERWATAAKLECAAARTTTNGEKSFPKRRWQHVEREHVSQGFVQAQTLTKMCRHFTLQMALKNVKFLTPKKTPFLGAQNTLKPP